MCERGEKISMRIYINIGLYIEYIYRVSSRKSGVVLRARSLKWVPRKKHISEAKYKKPQSVPPSLSLWLSFYCDTVRPKKREKRVERTCYERTLSVRRPPPKAHG